MLLSFQVINTTILKDLDAVNNEAKTKTKELRKERLRLIKEKINEQDGGSQLNIDIDTGELKIQKILQFCVVRL